LHRERGTGRALISGAVQSTQKGTDMTDNTLLQGKVALVTGSGRGVGREMALQMAR